MSLKDKKIGEYENSIATLPNRVTGRADWLKSQFDARTDKETKESINGIVDELVAASGAQQMGADVPPGVTPTPMPEVGGVSSVQAVLYGLRDYVNEKIVEIGAGDMAMAIYDPQGRAENIFALAPVGSITMYAGQTAPQGFLMCLGQEVRRVDYAELFAVCSTVFGGGDGSTTFNLPDMRGRFALADDTDIGIGKKGGVKDNVIKEANFPANINFKLNIYAQKGGTSKGGHVAWVNDGNAGEAYQAVRTNGTGQALNNMPPYLVLGYIIKT